MKNFLTQLKKFKKPKYIAILVVVVIIVIIVIFQTRGSQPDFETEIVKKGDVVQSVSETGITQAVNEVDLQFEQTGRVSKIQVSEGDKVPLGSTLVQLDSSEQYANVLSAQAQLKAAQADLVNLVNNRSDQPGVRSNFANTKEQQEAIVENAYSKLLSEGLVAEPSSDTYTVSAPIISGRYIGPAGQYKIIFRTGSQFNDYEISVFGLETVREVGINETGATAVGTRGLYLTLPDTVSDYIDTIWYVDLPNKKSSSYLTNYNAYISAKETANVTLIQTETTNEEIEAQEARVDQYRALLLTAQSGLAKRTIRAPFDGLVTSVDVSVGEIASPGTSAVSLISQDEFEIKLDVPEADISNVEVGDKAVVTFDAYDDAQFMAEVVAISPAAKLVQGVPSFETTLNFIDGDDRLRSGLSADVEILAAEKKDVLFIPYRAVFVHEGKSFVRVVGPDREIEEREVKTGLRGSLGTVEIVSGLSEGEEVVTFISEATLSSLKEKSKE